MIRSVAIENFRAFAHSDLDNLRRVNIFVGDNGSGKTSLLEAIMLASGSSPHLGLILKQARGLQIAQAAGLPFQQISADAFHSMWTDYFCGFNLEARIAVDIKGDNSHSRSFSMFVSENENLLLPFAGTQGATARPYRPVTFEWQTPGGPKISTSPQITPLGLQFQATPEPPYRALYIGAHAGNFAQLNAIHFSSLSKENREKEFISAITELFPEVTSISTESNAGGYVLHVATRWLDRKFPLSLYSDGMEKIAAIMLAISFVKGGIVCVDEIENGIYYTRHRGMWNCTKAFARDFSSQVFASTHSIECLRAAAEAFNDSPDDLALIQVFQEEGKSKALTVTGKDAIAAIENEIELR